MFNGCSNLEKIEDIGIPATNYTGTWYNCPMLREIAVVRCAAGKAFDVAFYNCHALEEVRFDGAMSTNGLDLQYSKNLSRESIDSLIDVLSASASGRTVTMSQEAVDKAYETAPGANDGSTSDAWATKILEKSKWTISLV